jgi:ABC-type glycerol-3-phosphate transport system permease component
MTSPRSGGWPVPRLVRGIFFYGFVALFVLAALLPVLWVVKMSLSPRTDLFQTPPSILPTHPTLQYYAEVMKNPTFQKAFLNSIIIAISTTSAALLLGGLAAYPLARLRFRFKSSALTGILALAFFPTVAIIAPLFKEFRTLGLLDSYVGVILVDTVFALPLAVWVLTAFFRRLPLDIEEAARVDGASTMQILTRIIVPLSAPGVVTTALLVFVLVWNEFLFANTFLFSQDRWPVTVAIPGFATIYSINYGAQAAASILVTVPLVLLVFVFQRRLVEGLTAGALKG